MCIAGVGDVEHCSSHLHRFLRVRNEIQSLSACFAERSMGGISLHGNGFPCRSRRSFGGDACATCQPFFGSVLHTLTATLVLRLVIK